MEDRQYIGISKRLGRGGVINCSREYLVRKAIQYSRRKKATYFTLSYQRKNFKTIAPRGRKMQRRKIII
jgi:hypothetical protein